MDKKKIISGLVTITATGALLVGATFAFFNDQDTNPDNVFAAGTLDIDILEDVGGTLPFDVSDMQPGDSTSECGGVTNAGSLPFNWKFTLNKTADVSGGGGGSLHDVLKARIQAWTGEGTPSADNCDNDTGSWTEIFNGYIADGTYPDPMGQLDPDENAYFRLTVSLDNDLFDFNGTDVTDNNYQGSTVTYEIQVDAFQLNDPAYSGTP